MAKDTQDKARRLWAEARGHFDTATAEANEEARRLLKEALELDPDFHRARGHLSYAYVRDHLYGWPSDSREPLATAEELAEKALAGNREDYDNHWSLGIVRLYQRRFQEAETLYLTARHRCPPTDPAYPTLLAEMAELLVAMGKAAEAATQVKEAIGLREKAGDKVPCWFNWNLGHARLSAGDAEGAVRALERTRQRPDLLKLDLALAYDARQAPGDAERAAAAMQGCAAHPETHIEVAARQPLGGQEVQDFVLGRLRRLCSGS